MHSRAYTASSARSPQHRELRARSSEQTSSIHPSIHSYPSHAIFVLPYPGTLPSFRHPHLLRPPRNAFVPSSLRVYHVQHALYLRTSSMLAQFPSCLSSPSALSSSKPWSWTARRCRTDHNMHLLKRALSSILLPLSFSAVQGRCPSHIVPVPMALKACRMAISDLYHEAPIFASYGYRMPCYSQCDKD